jgi:hypothetical protein
VSFFAACTKNSAKIPYVLTDQPSKALLKINYESPYFANPNVQLKLNDVRVSNIINYRSPFPGGGLNTLGNSLPDYLEVNPGSVKLSVAMPKAGTDIDSANVYSTTLSLEGGKYYIAHITDTAANTQTVLQTQDISKVDSGFSKYTFVNLMPNVAAIDVYFGTTVVAPNVPYKGISNVFQLGFTNANAWAIRPAGAAPTSTALATYAVGSVPNQRIFTVFAIGYSGAVDAVRKPYVSLVFAR